MSTIDRYIKAQGEEEQLEFHLVQPPTRQRYQLEQDGSEQYFIREVAPEFRRRFKPVLAAKVPNARILGRGGVGNLTLDREGLEFLIDVPHPRFPYARLSMSVVGSYMTEDDGEFYILVQDPRVGHHDYHEKFSGEPVPDARNMAEAAADLIADFINIFALENRQ